MALLKNTIVNFHVVQNQKWMESVLLFLRNHFNIISIGDLEKYYYSKTNLNNCCHITFDDGDISFYNIVFPLLKKYCIPTTIFVSPDAIKKRKNFWFQEIRGYDTSILLEIFEKKRIISGDVSNKKILSIFKSLTINEIWQIILEYQNITNSLGKECKIINIDQLVTLQKSGLVDIGAHTMNHPILKNESDEKAEEEIKESVDDLSNMLNDKVKYFAYPNGNPQTDFSEREMNILNKSGVRLAFSLENNTFSHFDNPLMIPRKGISKGHNFYIFLKLISGEKWDKARKILHPKKKLFSR